MLPHKKDALLEPLNTKWPMLKKEWLLPFSIAFTTSPLWLKLFASLGEDILLQSENAPVHKAYSIMDWFERNSIEVVEHSHSPDLNPIERAWVELKKRLHQQYPGIRNTSGGKDAVKMRLTQVLPLVWKRSFLRGSGNQGLIGSCSFRSKERLYKVLASLFSISIF